MSQKHLAKKLADQRQTAIRDMLIQNQTLRRDNTALIKRLVPVDKRTIVCLCGSTRFKREFHDANLRETLNGNIVLSIGADMRSDDEVFGHVPPHELMAIKAALDALHLDKIALADEVLILNKGGYIGDSTKRELAHARKLGKTVRFLEPESGARP